MKVVQRRADLGPRERRARSPQRLRQHAELTLPSALLRQNRLDGLWNDDFQTRVRAAILGESAGGDDFDWTVRKAIDCRLGGVFTDGAQAINYVTKHDAEGVRHERLFTMLRKMPDEQIENRIKLAFVCLMTAVGISMLLAGEEFADQHDYFDQDGNVTQRGGKQVDPVDFARLLAGPPDPRDRDPRNNEPDGYSAPRHRILEYVKRLVRLRTSAPALAVNDTDFIWSDFSAGKSVIVWRRGGANAPAPVIVLANFSDFVSAPGTDYVVPTWPGPAPAGKKWIEVTQARTVDPAYVGREAIFPWEAKVYTYADARAAAKSALTAAPGKPLVAIALAEAPIPVRCSRRPVAGLFPRLFDGGYRRLRARLGRRERLGNRRGLGRSLRHRARGRDGRSRGRSRRIGRADVFHRRTQGLVARRTVGGAPKHRHRRRPDGETDSRADRQGR
jgi:hypothetical protein